MTLSRIVVQSSMLLLTSSASFGCATIISGRSQTMNVDSNPQGARCELTREGRLSGTIEKTPGVTSIIKTKHDIEVLCKKPGLTDGKYFAESGTDSATYGNIILGASLDGLLIPRLEPTTNTLNK